MNPVVKNAIAGILARRFVIPPFPSGLSPVFVCEPGNFTGSGLTSDSWADTSGNSRPVTGGASIGSAGRTNVGNCPKFDYVGTSDVNVRLTNTSVTLSVFAGGASGNTHFFGVVDLDGTLVLSTNPYDCSSIISDDGGYVGLYFRRNAGSTQFWAGMYTWESISSTIRTSEVDVTSLLTAGAGRLVVEGRRTSGQLACRVNGGTWSSNTAVGATGPGVDTPKLVVGFRGNFKALAAASWSRALTGGESDSIAAWGLSLP